MKIASDIFEWIKHLDPKSLLVGMLFGQFILGNVVSKFLRRT